MAYATAEQLAAALRIQVIPGKNDELLAACLDAAAAEIDFELDRLDTDPLVEPYPATVIRTNVNRAVEWYKATDAALGAMGSADTGVLSARTTPIAPEDAFTRHARTIAQHKQQWGVA